MLYGCMLEPTISTPGSLDLKAMKSEDLFHLLFRDASEIVPLIIGVE